MLYEEIHRSRQIKGDLVAKIEQLPPNEKVTVIRLGDKLSDELNNEYKRIKDIQEKNEKSRSIFGGSSINQSFVSNRTGNITLTEYLNYLNEIENPLSSFSPKWKPLIEREIQIHGQIPDKCFAMLQYLGREEIE